MHQNANLAVYVRYFPLLLCVLEVEAEKFLI